VPLVQAEYHDLLRRVATQFVEARRCAQDVMDGGQGAQFPGLLIITRAPNDFGVAEKS